MGKKEKAEVINGFSSQFPSAAMPFRISLKHIYVQSWVYAFVAWTILLKPDYHVADDFCQIKHFPILVQIKLTFVSLLNEFALNNIRIVNKITFLKSKN